ncbi:hypothetical protein L6452_06423 [Arctium lappa]|uniref:Uncharacterized protein n=1 Tax=Arctium lappa TaxID=4217 RepID=A0ACB9EJH0_ARCLA|nr:hypothetical protein L6452_06423 [Arctium lappa]
MSIATKFDLVARFHDVDEEDFEFSLVNDDEHVSAEDTGFEGPVVFPLFDSDLLITNEADREAVAKVDDEEDACSASLGKLFINEWEEFASPSSSEADEYESEGTGVFCAWRSKMDIGSSSLSKCKKSSSTGSGSKRWRIRDLLRQSNNEGITGENQLPEGERNMGEDNHDLNNKFLN